MKMDKMKRKRIRDMGWSTNEYQWSMGNKIKNTENIHFSPICFIGIE